MDVRQTAAGWEFRYWIEPPSEPWPFEPWVYAAKCHFILTDPRGWARSGVNFRRVDTMAECDIIIRFTDAPPPDWPELPWGAGWYYHDSKLGKNVAQVTPQAAYFNDTPAYNYFVGMEVVGHGTFRMWDMYIPEHEPYPVGAMGGYAAAMETDGWPTDTEIECAKAWLRGEAVHVHDHPQFTVPDQAQEDADVATNS